MIKVVYSTSFSFFLGALFELMLPQQPVFCYFIFEAVEDTFNSQCNYLGDSVDIILWEIKDGEETNRLHLQDELLSVC